MKTTLNRTVTATAMMLTLGFAGSALSGCAATAGSGYERAGSTSESLTVVREEIAEAKPKVSETVNTLENLVNRPAADLKPQFEEFAAAVREAERRERRISSRVTTYENRRDSYMERWQADIDEISNVDLRDRALSRKSETRDSFADLDEKLATMQEDYDALLDQLNDLRRFLSSDLTIAGISSIRTDTEEARELEGQLQDAMDDAIEALDEIAGNIAPSGS